MLSHQYLRAPYTIKKTVNILKPNIYVPIFEEIFDAKSPTQVPSKFWSKFIVLKMFNPDAVVAVAIVWAECSPEDWIFDQNFDRSPHTR